MTKIKFIRWPVIGELKIGTSNIKLEILLAMKRGDYLTTQGEHYKILYAHYDMDIDTVTIHIE